jgi:hypothetical protein
VLNVQVTGAVTMTGGRIGASNGDKDGAVKLLGRLAMSGKAWIDGGIYNAGQISLSEAAVVSGAGIFFTTEASPIEVLGFLTPQYNAEAGSPAKSAKIVVADPQAGAVLSGGESAAALAVSDSKGETLELNEEGAVGIGNVKNIRAESETGKLTLRWDDPDYDGYAGVRIGAFLGNAPLPGSPVTKVKGTLYHTFDGLTNGTEYTFKLQAFKSLSELSAAYTVKASPEKVFDSADELGAYLSARSAAEGTLGNPLSLRVSYVGNSQAYSTLLNLIDSKQKYVRLDLGPSDFSGNNCKLEYVQALSARELWIVSLKLPESVWEIKTGGTEPSAKQSIFGITTPSNGGATPLGYWNMESIEMPGVREIGYGAFSWQPATNVPVLSATQSIPDSLTSVSMPVVEKIGDYAFEGRKGLKHIYAPKLKDVSGFKDCANLQSIEISPEAHTIGRYAFANCERLASILPGTNKITTVKYYAFSTCTSFNEFDFPSLTVLESNAFQYCKALVSVTLPETVTKIPAYAFNGCINLEKIIAPGVESVGEAIATGQTATGLVFTNCYALKTVSMENLKTVTGSGVFQTCSALEEISFPVLESGGSAMFSGCTSLKSADLPELKTAGSMFFNCTSLTLVNLPNLENDSGSMFSGCTSLASVNLPNLKTAGNSMFAKTKISSIALPQMTTLGNLAFDGCENLEAVYMPALATLTSIASNYLFRNCYKLNYIILGQNVPSYSGANGSTSAMNYMFVSTGRDVDGDGFIIYVANEDAKTDLLNRIVGKLNTFDGWFRGLATAENKDSGATLVTNPTQVNQKGSQKFAGSTTAANGVKLYGDIPDNIKTLFGINEE